MTKLLFKIVFLFACLTTQGQTATKIKKVDVHYFLQFESAILKDSTYPYLLTNNIFLTAKSDIDTIKSKPTLDSIIWLFNKYPSLLCDGKIYKGNNPLRFTKLRYKPEGQIETYLSKKIPPGIFSFFTIHCGVGNSSEGPNYNLKKQDTDKTLTLIIRLYSRDILDKQKSNSR